VLDLRDAEVRELEVALEVHEDVGRADVAVDDPQIVRVCERLEHVDHEHEAEVEWHGLFERLEQRAQIAARHVLERHPPGLAFAAEVVDLGDVRMDQARRELGLALEPFDEVGLRGALGEHSLETDLAPEPFVPRPEGEKRLCHPAATERPDDLERPEPHGRGSLSRRPRAPRDGQGPVERPPPAPVASRRCHRPLPQPRRLSHPAG
jgi:hypothetical protein